MSKHNKWVIAIAIACAAIWWRSMVSAECRTIGAMQEYAYGTDDLGIARCRMAHGVPL